MSFEHKQMNYQGMMSNLFLFVVLCPLRKRHRNMAEILPIRCKILSNQSINQSIFILIETTPLPVKGSNHDTFAIE